MLQPPRLRPASRALRPPPSRIRPSKTRLSRTPRLRPPVVPRIIPRAMPPLPTPLRPRLRRPDSPPRGRTSERSASPGHPTDVTRVGVWTDPSLRWAAYHPLRVGDVPGRGCACALYLGLSRSTTIRYGHPASRAVGDGLSSHSFTPLVREFHAKGTPWHFSPMPPGSPPVPRPV